MRVARIYLAVSLAAASLATGIAQTSPPTTQSGQAPVFKSRLDVVRVDVTVIDNKTGKPVVGLTERDFTVSENGVKQAIASFADESLAAASADPADPANRRVFLFIINAGNYDPYKKHEGVAQFIRERLRPQDLVAVMSLGRLSQLTTDHQRVATIVDRLKQPMPLAYRDLQHVKKGDRWAPPLELERFADNWMEPGSASTDFFRSPVPFLLGSSRYAQNIEDMTLPWHVRLEVQDALKIVAGIEYLRNIRGDKHIVMLTPSGFDPPFSLLNEGTGLYLRSADDDKRFAAQANDAGVAVDIILLSGTGGSVKGTMSSANVAEHSGGQFTSLRIVPQQMPRIDEGTRNGYIVGYMPSKPELDGKYRDIKITVDRKDVTIVYRHGYTAVSKAEPIDPREVFTRQRLRDAAAGATDINDIGLKVRATPVAGATAQMSVSLNIDITKLPLSEKAGKWEGDIDVLILCGDRKRQVVCRLDQRMTLSMSAEKYAQAKAGGVPYSTTIPLTGQAALLKVIVYHFDSDRIGVYTTDLK